MTESTEYRFTVKGGSNGKVWLACEPLSRNLKVLDGGFLGLKLKAGTNVSQAQEIARTMNAAIVGVSYTSRCGT